jgi:TolB-like protein/Flp pilus assembly protein TadD
MSLYSELKRRNVFRVAIAYLAGAWLLTEVAETIFPLYGFSDMPARIVVTLLAIGFPLFLVFSWVFEVTPEGLKQEKDVRREESITPQTGKKLDRIIIVLLALALGYFAFDKFVLDPVQDAKIAETAAQAGAEQALAEAKEAILSDKSIAVLPFVNMSADPGQEYFSDGLSEELLNLLAQTPELRVISRSSAFYFKDKDVKLADIARELNVAHILEGSVRKTGSRVRITAQLIDARSDTHLWSQTYDRTLDDIFAVQDESAGAITDALIVKLALSIEGETVRPTVIKAANTDAYDAYLRGRELIRLRGRQNLEEAVRHLERALRLDETFAAAHAQLAIAIALLESSSATYGTLSREEVLRIALPHLDRVQELEPDLAEAHAGRALLALNGDLESTVEHARKALAVNPSYSDAMHWLYLALKNLGRYEEASATLMQMLVTDPLNIVGRHAYGLWLARRGRVEEAHEMADQLLLQSPRGGYAVHAQISVGWEGKIAEGLSWALKAYAEDPSTYIFSEYRVLGFIWVGEYDEARRIDDELAYLVDVAEGRFDDAIQATQKRMQLDPNNVEAIAPAANVLYAAGRIDEALPLYERLRNFVPEGRPIPKMNKIDFLGGWMTMRLALASRQAGDDDGAQAAAQIVRQDQAARHAAGRKDQREHRTEAMLAAFEHNPDRVTAALKSAIQLGLRDPQVFDDPIFEDLWDEPRFVALKQELDAILAVEHDKVLQLICFNNPTPDNWQPLPDTCQGVENTKN